MPCLLAWARQWVCWLATGDTDALDSHGDVIGKLSPVEDVLVVACVDNVAHGQLLAVVIWAFANDAVGDLDLQPQAHIFGDIAALPAEGANGDVDHVLASSLNVELKVGRIEGVDIERDGIGD